MLALVSKFNFSNYDFYAFYQQLSSKDFGDIDVYGIYPVLSAAAIMITPILNWSVSIRSSRAQPVVIWWAVLVLVALVPAWLYFSLRPDGDFNSFPNKAVSLAICPISSNENCGEDMYLDADTFKLCQCFDFCGTFSAPAPMRSGANMVPWLTRKITRQKSKSEAAWEGFLNVMKFNQFAIGFIFVQGALGVLESQFTQAEVRNIIFRFLYLAPKDYFILLLKGERRRRWLRRLRLGSAAEETNKESVLWMLRRFFAKMVAASIFGVGICFVLICPAVFVTSAVANELFITEFPVSEHSDAIGAWGSWIGTALVVLAGAVIRYRDAWESTMTTAVYRIWAFFAYDSHERPGSPITEQEQIPLTELMKPTTTIHERTNAFKAEVASPILHVWHALGRSIYRAKVEWIMFREWWNDPVNQSKRNWEDMLDETRERMKECPQCPCHFCERHNRDAPSDEEDTSRYFATWGQRLVSGLEKTYSLHKAGSRAPSYIMYSKTPQSEVTDIRSKSRLSMPTSDYSDLIPVDSEENLVQSPLESHNQRSSRHPSITPPQPLHRDGRRQSAFEDYSQFRRNFQSRRQLSESYMTAGRPYRSERQNSQPDNPSSLRDSESTLVRTDSPFRIPRKPVASMSSETWSLLGGETPPLQHNRGPFSP